MYWTVDVSIYLIYTQSQFLCDFQCHFATRAGIVCIDSGTRDTIRVSSALAIRFFDISINRYTPNFHYIRDIGQSIWVGARTQSKQVNWCFVFTLIWVCVRDFCLGRPCLSSSLHVAISSGLGRPTLSEVVRNTCSKPPVHVVATVGYQNGWGLGWPQIQASDVV